MRANNDFDLQMSRNIKNRLTLVTKQALASLYSYDASQTVFPFSADGPV